MPNPAGTVSLKLDFVGAVGQNKEASTLVIPEGTVEAGIGRGFETVVQIPLLRESAANGTSVLAGGQLSFALRYLLAGSGTAKYAVSVAGRLEVPTGDSAIVGNTTQLMPMLLAEWRPVHFLLFRSNIAWNKSISGTRGWFANFQHGNAVAWLATRHFIPVFEFAGSTNTSNGNTQLVLQPEVIFAEGPHVELKTGLSIALSPSPHYVIRSQLAWFWGKRE